MATPRFRFGEQQGLVLILGASLIAYAAVFALYRVTSKGRNTEIVSSFRVRWMPPGGQPSNPAVYRLADLLDPSLMSLPSVHGFSRPMWEHQFVSAYRDQPWNIAPAFLEPNLPRNDQPLLRQMTPLELVQTTAGKAAGQLDEPTMEPLEPPVLVNRSVYRLGGSLAGRDVLRAPPLPPIASETGLRPTWIRVGVTVEGEVRFALVERSCGTPAVDAQAVDLARQFRLAPRAGSDAPNLAWGVIKFNWATEPPAAARAATGPAR